MKRYMVFCGSIYYPERGMKDFKNSFDDIKYARKYCKRYLEDNNHSWAQIYDLETCKIIDEYVRN